MNHEAEVTRLRAELEQTREIAEEAISHVRKKPAANGFTFPVGGMIADELENKLDALTGHRRVTFRVCSKDLLAAQTALGELRHELPAEWKLRVTPWPSDEELRVVLHGPDDPQIEQILGQSRLLKGGFIYADA